MHSCACRRPSHYSPRHSHPTAGDTTQPVTCLASTLGATNSEPVLCCQADTEQSSSHASWTASTEHRNLAQCVIQQPRSIAQMARTSICLCWGLLILLCAAPYAHAQANVIVPKPMKTGSQAPKPTAVPAAKSPSPKPRVVAPSPKVEVIIPPITPPSDDGSSEEIIPGLEPTDGSAVRAMMPDWAQFANLVTLINPTIPLMRPLAKLFNLDQPFWQLSQIEPRVQGTLLVPTPEAYVKLMADLLLTSLPWDRIKKEPPIKRELMVIGMKAKMVKQLADNMVVPHLVNTDMMNNGTRIVTRANQTLTVLVKSDGKYLTGNGMEAKIVRGDQGVGPVQFHVVDAFLVPAFKL